MYLTILGGKISLDNVKTYFYSSYNAIYKIK